MSDAKTLQRLVAEGAQLVEVLPKEELDEQHLRGAIHIPLRKIDTGVRASLAAERPSSSSAGTLPETRAHEPCVAA